MSPESPPGFASTRDFIVARERSCADEVREVGEIGQLLRGAVRRAHRPVRAWKLCGERSFSAENFEQVSALRALDRGASGRNQGFLELVLRAAAVAGNVHVRVGRA